MTNRRDPDPRRCLPDRRTADRRDSIREPSEARIRFLRAGTSTDEILAGELLDASVTGVRLLLEEQLLPTEKLLIEVRDGGNRCFNLTAEVVWSEPAGDHHYRVGCELCVELSAKQHALLNRLATVRHFN